MTDRDIQIGDSILKLINEKGGYYSQQIYIHTLAKDYGYNHSEIATVSNILTNDYKVLRYSAGDNSVKFLTKEGKKALEIGLHEYIKQFEKNNALPTKLSKWAIFISIFLPIALFSAGELINYCNNKTKDIIIEKKLIKAVSDSLKSDTTFIKEIIKKSHNQ
jgi:hypothetical protein